MSSVSPCLPQLVRLKPYKSDDQPLLGICVKTDGPQNTWPAALFLLRNYIHTGERKVCLLVEGGELRTLTASAWYSDHGKASCKGQIKDCVYMDLSEEGGRLRRLNYLFEVGRVYGYIMHMLCISRLLCKILSFVRKSLNAVFKYI